MNWRPPANRNSDRGSEQRLHRDLAEQLQAAQREAQESQTQVQMRLPFEASLDDREPKFYAMPQPQMMAPFICARAVLGLMIRPTL